MGSVKKQNHVNLNLQNANYISLNTPFDDDASSKEDVEFKASGDKLFNYIRLFLKTKSHSRRGTKAHSLRGDSQTRRRHRRSKDNSSVSLSIHQTRKHRNNNRNRLRSKTQRIGKFMRI
jgi:hypothetical protein